MAHKSVTIVKKTPSGIPTMSAVSSAKKKQLCSFK